MANSHTNSYRRFYPKNDPARSRFVKVFLTLECQRIGLPGVVAIAQMAIDVQCLVERNARSALLFAGKFASKKRDFNIRPR